MDVTGRTLYIKAERNSKVDRRSVVLGDIARMECSDPHVVSRLKTLKVLAMPQDGKTPMVVSMLKIIQLIHTVYPDLEVQNLGDPEAVVEFNRKQPSRIWEFFKVALVCCIVFFGSGFAIMTFNNDVSVNHIFKEMYQLMMGKPSNGFTTLEVSYSLGLALGITIFYNHFAGKKITRDPTPIEVEMRAYEDSVNNAIVENSGRKGQSVDVD